MLYKFKKRNKKQQNPPHGHGKTLLGPRQGSGGACGREESHSISFNSLMVNMPQHGIHAAVCDLVLACFCRLPKGEPLQTPSVVPIPVLKPQ